MTIKKTIVSCIFLFSLMVTKAQDYNTTIGLTLTPGIATIYQPMFSDNYARLTINCGLEIRKKILGDKLFIESGLSVMNRGYKYHFLVGNIDERTSTEYNYNNIFLCLPVSLVLKLNGFYLGSGLSVNYYVAERYYIDGKLASKKKNSSVDNILYGMQAFAGYEMFLNNHFLFSVNGCIAPAFKVRYRNYGLSLGVKYKITD